MNIYQKLLEVRKAVPFLKKDNAGYQFKYVSSSQTLGALREAMDVNGLILIPKVLNERALDHTTKKGEHQYFTVLNMEFTWVNVDDPKETVVCPWVGQGIDDGEKGVGKALTYSEKFFLLKFFNIPTDKDDPDANQKKPDKQDKESPNKQEEPPSSPQQNQQPQQGEKISDAQAKRFFAIAKGAGKSDELIKAYITDLKLEHTKDMLKASYDAACKWAAEKIAA